MKWKLSLKKYHILGLVLKLNSRLSFLPLFTGGKKCLEFLPCDTGLSEIFRTPLLHLRKTLEKRYCLLEPYYMVLRLFSLKVPSSHVITTPVCGIRKSSGWYAFT